MSHNINEERVFTVGKSWHGLGTVVEQAVKAQEAIKLARLDYEVEQVPLFTYNSVKNEHTDLGTHVAIQRKDTKDILGITTPKYKIIQNVEAFSFFDTVVGEGQAIYHSAGALGKGERIWILAKLPSNIVIGQDDVIEKYLCLTTTHDGKNSLKAYFTPVRVVCQNTLNMSMVDAKNGISIRHSGNIKDKVEEAREILGITVDFYNQFETIVNQFENKPLSKNEVENYFDKILKIEDKKEDEISTRKENQKKELLVLFDRGKGQNLGNKHSLWKAYNAVTEYVDHKSAIKNLGKDETNRIKNIWFGTGARLKEQAYNEALALI